MAEEIYIEVLHQEGNNTSSRSVKLTEEEIRYRDGIAQNVLNHVLNTLIKDCDGTVFVSPSSVKDVVTRRAYTIADAMLKARNPNKFS